MWRPNVRPVSDAARGKALFGPPMFMQNSEVSSHTGLRVVFSAFPELEQVPSLRVNSWVDSSGFVACCACWRRATNQSLNAAITELRMPRQLWKVKYFRRNVQIATPQAGVFAGLFRARVRFHFASSFSRSSILQQIFHSSADLPFFSTSSIEAVRIFRRLCIRSVSVLPCTCSTGSYQSVFVFWYPIQSFYRSRYFVCHDKHSIELRTQHPVGGAIERNFFAFDHGKEFMT
jgi:hypothetical protein